MPLEKIQRGGSGGGVSRMRTFSYPKLGLCRLFSLVCGGHGESLGKQISRDVVSDVNFGAGEESVTWTARDEVEEKDLADRGIGRNDRDARPSVDNITQVREERTVEERKERKKGLPG
jgi:hypothetical protein